MGHNLTTFDKIILFFFVFVQIFKLTIVINCAFAKLYYIIKNIF